MEGTPRYPFQQLPAMARLITQLIASVGCHLYNPTFMVDDPCYAETEDLSNASMSQINDAGFSTQNNCYHLSRRDVSNHCATVYPEGLLDIHEGFIFALRDAMKAKIEICWGANVRKRMFTRILTYSHFAAGGILQVWYCIWK